MSQKIPDLAVNNAGERRIRQFLAAIFGLWRSIGADLRNRSFPCICTATTTHQAYDGPFYRSWTTSWRIFSFVRNSMRKAERFLRILRALLTFQCPGGLRTKASSQSELVAGIQRHPHFASVLQSANLLPEPLQTSSHRYHAKRGVSPGMQRVARDFHLLRTNSDPWEQSRARLPLSGQYARSGIDAAGTLFKV